MRIVAVVQARMGSTRLPGKVLADIGGQPMLERVIRRLQCAGSLNGVMVATTTEPADMRVVTEAERLGAEVFRGSSSDVLDRYVRAAAVCDADTVVRVTADCPLIDPEIVTDLVGAFVNARPAAHYVSNTLERTYPRGLDVEVIDRRALERAGREAHKLYEREHVTPYLYEHPEAFRLLSFKNAGDDHSHYRWTVDVAEDLALVREIYRRLEPNGEFGWRDVVALVQRHPELVALNAHIDQQSIHNSSPIYRD